MPRARTLAAALAAAGVAAGLGACGKQEVTPAVTGPTQTTTTGPSGAGPAIAPSRRHKPPPTLTNPPAGSGGTPAPVGGTPGHGREAQRDFRKYCDTHPGACGD
ncbi:MAG: hypothetical protein ACJ76S_05255 [Solirubrobacteraceae bacterium]|jgi:hypothetical protein